MMMMIHLLFLRYYKYLLQIFDVFPLLGNEGLVASLAGMSTTGWAGRDTRSHCLHSAALVTLIVTL